MLCLTRSGWIHINQDALGSADECKKALEKAVKHGRNVVLDRCNVHAKERKMWITDAKHYCSEGQKYTFQAVFMDTPIGTPAKSKTLLEISKKLTFFGALCRYLQRTRR